MDLDLNFTLSLTKCVVLNKLHDLDKLYSIYRVIETTK